jgi:uncharacterized protein with HEPN domain
MAKYIRNILLYLDDMLESIARIKEYTEGFSFDDFRIDKKTIDAVIRNFEIIGEAASQIPANFRNKHSNIEWKAIKNFRNVIIHEYFGVNLEIIWDLIENELPMLERDVLDLYHSESKGMNPPDKMF